MRRKRKKPTYEVAPGSYREPDLLARRIDPIPSTGQGLRRWRLDNNWTQQSVAEAIGIPRRTLQQHESNRRQDLPKSVRLVIAGYMSGIPLD